MNLLPCFNCGCTDIDTHGSTKRGLKAGCIGCGVSAPVGLWNGLANLRKAGQGNATLIKLMADDIRSSRYTASNGEVDLTRGQVILEFKAITGG